MTLMLRILQFNNSNSLNPPATSPECQTFNHLVGCFIPMNFSAFVFLEHFRNTSDLGHLSWVNALDVCHQVGGNLPILTGKDDLNGVINLLKVAGPRVFLTDGMYIGLIFNLTKMVIPVLQKHPYVSHSLARTQHW